MGQHLILFDGTCGLCLSLTKFFSRIDSEGRFNFAPIQGETAKRFLSPEEQEALDTFYLIEDFQTAFPKKAMRAKGVFRAFWLLGGFFPTLIGSLQILPSFIIDTGYRLVARSRRRLFGVCRLEDAPRLPRQLP